MAKKKLKIGKSAKKALGIGGQILATGVTLAGAVFGGAPGATAGAALGSGIRAATTSGNREDKLAAAKKQLAIGGTIIALTGIVGAASGQGIMAPLTKSVPSLFGGSTPEQHQEQLRSNSLVPDGQTKQSSQGNPLNYILGSGQSPEADPGQPGQESEEKSNLPMLLGAGAVLFLATRRRSA